MKIRQRIAIEKITGEDREWHPDAVKVFFAFTDRGIKLDCSLEGQEDLDKLLFAHRFHPVTVEMWKEDFKRGLLCPADFNDSPEHHLKHALNIYREALGIK